MRHLRCKRVRDRCSERKPCAGTRPLENCQACRIRCGPDSFPRLARIYPVLLRPYFASSFASAPRQCDEAQPLALSVVYRTMLTGAYLEQSNNSCRFFLHDHHSAPEPPSARPYQRLVARAAGLQHVERIHPGPVSVTCVHRLTPGGTIGLRGHHRHCPPARVTVGATTSEQSLMASVAAFHSRSSSV